MSVKKITNVGVLTGLSILLMILIKFPIIPGMSFLLYDPGDISILIISFLYGPLPALLSAFLSAVLMALVIGDFPYGALMHFIATGTFVGVAGFIYQYKHNRQGALIALLAGAFSMTVIMIPANLFITPIYLGASYQQVLKLLLPGIIPFNLLKSIINSAITVIVYKRLANFLREKGLIKTSELVQK